MQHFLKIPPRTDLRQVQLMVFLDIPLCPLIRVLHGPVDILLDLEVFGADDREIELLIFHQHIEKAFSEVPSTNDWVREHGPFEPGRQLQDFHVAILTPNAFPDGEVEALVWPLVLEMKRELHFLVMFLRGDLLVPDVIFIGLAAAGEVPRVVSEVEVVHGIGVVIVPFTFEVVFAFGELVLAVTLWHMELVGLLESVFEDLFVPPDAVRLMWMPTATAEDLMLLKSPFCQLEGIPYGVSL